MLKFADRWRRRGRCALAFLQWRHQSIERAGHVGFRFGNRNFNHGIVAFCEPCMSLGAGGLALPVASSSGYDFDDRAQRETKPSRRYAADRHLPLEAAAGEAAVLGRARPTTRARHRSDCGAAAAPARAPARARSARALRRARRAARAASRLVAVEHAAARGPLAALAIAHDHAMQRLDVLLRRLHARRRCCAG